MTGSASIWRKTCFALSVLALLCAGGTRAAIAQQTVPFRRVMVPADDPANWPRAEKTLLPIDAAEFANAIAAGSTSPTRPVLAFARYEARLQDGKLVDGRGLWELKTVADAPALLPIGTISLRIRHPKWSTGDDDVRLGWWPSADGERFAYALEVPRAAQLAFDWEIEPSSTAAGSITFPLQLPLATRTEIALELPRRVRPMIEGAVTLAAPPAGEAGRWVFALNSTAPLTLRIDGAGGSNALMPSFHEQTTYRLDKRGIDMESRFKFGAALSANAPLRFTLPAELRLVSVRWQDEELPWVNEPNLDDKNFIEARVAKPVKVGGQGGDLVVRAWAPFDVSTARRLPRLALTTAAWTGGSLELQLDNALQFRQLAPIDCFQTEITSQVAHEQLVFVATSPAANIEFAIDHRAPRGRVIQGTTLDVNYMGIESRTMAEISLERGQVHKLVAELQPGWAIDSLDSIPADAIAEWHVESTQLGLRLEVQLQRALSADLPISFVVTGRMQRAAALNPLPLQNACPLVWKNLNSDANWLQLLVGEQFELETDGPVTLFTAPELPPTIDRLFADSSKGSFCQLADSADAHAAIQAAPRKGTLDAAIQVAASLQPGRAELRYRVECRPSGGGIDHVLVAVANPPRERLSWFEAATNTPLVAERLPATDPRLGGLPEGCELWQLNLHHLYARPVTIEAVQSVAWADKLRVPLLAVPEAESQQGRIVISSEPQCFPRLLPEAMIATPLPPREALDVPPSSRANVVATYRFQPMRFYDSASTPVLAIATTLPGDQGPLLVARSLDIESSFTATGGGVHRATMMLETHGAGVFELTLPEGVRCAAARLDGAELASGKSSRVSLPLPPARNVIELVLDLESRQPPLVNGDLIRSPLAEATFPVLDGRWRIRLPLEFDIEQSTEVATDVDWRQQIFGRVARPRQARIFNPLAPASWNAIWASLSRFWTPAAQAASEKVAAQAAPPAGWHTVEFPFISVPPRTLTVSNPTSLHAWSLAIVLFAAVGATCFQLRVITLLLAGIAAAMLAALLPLTLSPLLAAAMWGLLAAALWRWLNRTPVRPAAALIFAAALVFAAAASIAATSPVLAAPTPEVIEQVLIPTDASGQPTGSKYFVSERFFRALLAEAAAPLHARNWLLSNLQCEGELTSAADTTQPTKPWRLIADLQVFARDTQVRLPLPWKAAHWATTATLDGLPATIARSADDDSGVIQVAEPGRYRLIVFFEPRSTTSNGVRQVSLRVPPAGLMQLNLSGSIGLGEVTGTAPLIRRDNGARSTWIGEFDSAHPLELRWDNTALPATTQVRRADQFLSLQIEPAEVLLDAQFVLPAGASWPEHVDVRVDGDWEWLPERAVSANGDRGADTSAGVRIFRVRPSEGGTKLSLQLRARRLSPFGRLRLPRMELSTARVENRWLAIAWNSSFEVTPSSAIPATAIPATFANQWGAVKNAPQLILDAGKLSGEWYLSVAPRRLVSTTQDRLSLSLGADAIQVDYVSDIVPSNADQFAWSLAVPSSLQVDGVTMTAGGETIPLDWARSSPTRLNIFYKRRAEQAFRLRLTGQVPMEPSDEWPLPRIAPESAAEAPQTVAIYGQPNVIATCQVPKGTIRSEAITAADSSLGSKSRFIAAYVADAASFASARVHVAPNLPHVDGNTGVVMSNENGVWQAELHTKLLVRQGEIDELRWQVPDSWVGPFELPPGFTAHLQPGNTPAKTRALIVGLPKMAGAGDSIALQIRSPLTLLEGQSVSAPLLRLLTPGKRSEYLAIPGSLAGQSLTWSLGGVETAAWPADLTLGTDSAGDPTTFRIVAEAPSVSLRRRPAQPAGAAISLAETDVHRDAAGHQYSVTQFTINPAGLDKCSIDLPGRERLVGMRLEGRRAAACRVDNNRWELAFNCPSLPQSLVVITETVDLPANSRNLELQRPIVRDLQQALPVEFALWTVHHFQQGTTPRLTHGSTVAADELAALRLERLVALSQRSIRAVINTPLADGYAWYLHWVSRLRSAALEAGRPSRFSSDGEASVRVPQPTDDQLADPIERSEAWIDQLAEVFAAATLDPLSIDVADMPTNPLHQAFDAVEKPLTIISEGGQNHLTVEFEPDHWTPGAVRWATLAALLAVGSGLFWLSRLPRVVTWIESHPAIVGVAIGLTIWLWLAPSVLGMTLAVASGGWLARSLLSDKKSPRHDGIQQAISIPQDSA